MMELQLKHLACYLPYGLKWDWSGIIVTMNGIKKESELIIFTTDGVSHIPSLDLQASFPTKPLLYPLSSLTEPIKHKGASFIPASMLGHKPIYDAGGILEFGTYIHDLSIENTPYKYIQKLLEWHFDIHGLIAAGLAIDVTTLDKNPYE